MFNCKAKKKEKDMKILQAACDEFLHKGFDAASMQAVSDEAQVSKRTLYKYYPTKEELYQALIDMILDRVEDMHSLKYESDKSIEEQIKKTIDYKLNLTMTDSFITISKITISELLKGRVPSQDQLERLTKSESLFIDWIKRAQDEKKITSQMDPVDISEQFHSILKGQVFWPLLMGLKEKKDIDIEKVKRTTLEFFMNSFTK